MNESSHKSSPRKETLAMDPNVAKRLGPTRYALIKLWVHDVNGRLDEVLAPFVTPNTSILDAGCSRGDPDLPSMDRAKHAVGCDVDLAGLRANTLIRDRVQSTLDALPYRDNSFDAVLCKFVIEHLATPLSVFREFARVLRPGGVVAILTPNRLSPMAVASSMIPYSIKAAFKERLFGGHAEDTFETLYRANTPRQLTALMGEAGLRPEQVETIAGLWAFFIFSKPLALAVRALERIQMRIPFLRSGCTHILGVWRKPLSAEAA